MNRYSLYIHLPFCLTRCPYCDFFSTTIDPIPFTAYREALVREWEARLALITSKQILSVYIGGGTPSLWPSAEIAALLQVLPSREAREVTVEVNPKDISLAWLRELQSAGVSRFSIGVQALDDRRLAILGRRHDKVEAIRALEAVRRSGAPTMSADLIYGTPGQTPGKFAEELRALVALGVDHVSAYELTLTKHSALSLEVRSGRISLPDEETMVALWHLTREVLASEGLLLYEVSSYARPGRASVHNAHYWTGGEYIGVGLGAHGFIKAPGGPMVRYANQGSIDAYIQASFNLPAGLTSGIGETASHEIITPLDHARERIMLGLRTTRGVDFTRVLQDLSAPTATAWQAIRERLVERELAEMKGGNLVPTTNGLLHADAVAEEFF